MTYKDFEIVANTQSYDLYSLDDDGNLSYHKYNYMDSEIISYTFTNDDDILDGEYGSFTTIEECKKAIDNLRSK